MSKSTSLFRRNLATASCVPVIGYRATLTSCSRPTNLNFYSTNTPASEPTEITEKEKSKALDAKPSDTEDSSGAPRILRPKADGVQLGYIIDASAAPNVTELLNQRVKGKASSRLHWSKRQTMFKIPLAHHATIESWAQSAESSQPNISFDLSDPACLQYRVKPARGTYAATERVELFAESPTLAALGDTLFAKLKEEMKAEDSKTLKKLVGRESRWGFKAALQSSSVSKESVEPIYKKLQATYKEKFRGEKISVTGVWVEKAKDGVREVTEYPFKG